MITKIKIGKTASYSVDGVTIEPKPINYIFGTNGTGKTTISRVIGNSGAFEGSIVEWHNDQALDVFVYNRDFIESNFASQIKGVFTLGAAEKSTHEELKTKDDERVAIQDELNGLNATLTSKVEERNRSTVVLQNACWQQRTKFKGEFKKAFTGAMGSESAFCKKVLKEAEDNTSDLQSLNTLQQKAKTVFSGSLEKVDLIPPPDFSEIKGILLDSIWQKTVIGSADIELARLIEKLENSDWVGEGRKYLDHTDEACPFCQQALPHDFQRQLEAYFGGQFAQDMTSINDLIDKHANQCRQILTPLETLSENQKSFFEEGFEVSIRKLREIFQDNHRALKTKADKPSQKMELTDIEEVCAAITSKVSSANERINRHNTLINNAKAEKNTLTGEVWKYIIEELKEPLKTFKKGISGIDNAISSLESQIERKKNQLAKLDGEIAELERNAVSVRPTVEAINETLRDYGFTGFQLEVDSEQEDKYRLLRNSVIDNEIHKTLSEGERSFITFLYFYHLISGSLSSSGTLSERVIVFDDPVSSLDSNVLFIVSTMVREIIRKVKEDDKKFKQVFVLTHNVFFHKQVTFRADGRHAFWLVQKREGVTSLNPCATENPVETTYGLLWAELKVHPMSNTALPNALRRILEYYFNFLGGYNFDDILNMFEGNEKSIVNSLISWAHAGSHGEIDDIDYAYPDLDAQKKVFEDIFEKTGNIRHYNMMMGVDSSGNATS